MKALNMRGIIVFIGMLLFPMAVTATNDGEEGGKKQPALLRGLTWLKTKIDSMAIASVDRNYIGQPELPWAVELRTDANQTTLKMTEELLLGTDGSLGTITAKTDNGFSTSIGMWAGYRGYGIGLSKELTGGDGATLSFGAIGGSLGINVRISSYRSKQPEIGFLLDIDENRTIEYEKANLDDPIRVRSLFMDGYYMFNGKRFSYAAAYDQSLIQKRSAGSLMAGLMYYHSSVAYDDMSNLPLLILMSNLGKVKCTQASVGVGYAYNWVPAKGWLVSVMAMPMLSFYNKMKSYEYDVVDKNGKSIDELSEIDIWDVMDGNSEGFSLVEKSVYETTNQLSWNFDARLSVSYNWRRVYLRTYGHYNRFRFHNNTGDSRLTDWKMYVDLGFRF